MGEVYLGSMGWSYKQWEIYDGLKAADYLGAYSQLFNSVEVNNTFYRIPRESSMVNWASKVPDGFRFTVKFPRTISHSSGLEPDQGRLEAFLSRVQLMGDKAGPLLIQFPPTLKPDHLEKLSEFLDKLPLVYRYAVEFRHKDWFNEDTYGLLSENNVAVVNVEHPWQAKTREQTADFSYIRLEGDRKSVKGDSGQLELDRSELNQNWSKRILDLTENGDVYCYVSKHYSGYPPTDLKQLRDNLGFKETH